MIPTSIHTPFRPHFGMYFKTQLLETSKGRDLGLLSFFLSSFRLSFSSFFSDFDRAVHAYYSPYHTFIDSLARYAYNQDALNGSILNLVTLVACEGIQSTHLHTFAKLCLEIVNTSKTRAQTLIHDLLQTHSSYYFHHYIEIVLIDERISLYQTDNYLFLHTYLPMILNMKKSSSTTTTTTNDSIQTFIHRLEQLLSKAAEHCLQSITNESQSNLDWLQSFKKLYKSIDYSHMQIIGDIKALEIYLHCPIAKDKTKIQHVIEENIRLIEQHLQLPLQIDDEQISTPPPPPLSVENEGATSTTTTTTTIVDDENNPIKKRRLDETNFTLDISNNNDPKRKTILDALQILQTFFNQISQSTDQPNTIEQ